MINKIANQVQKIPIKKRQTPSNYIRKAFYTDKAVVTQPQPSVHEEQTPRT